jgi:cytochrome c2
MPRATVNNSVFRAHNIAYVEFAKTLAVSHEYFDKKTNTTRLAVSVIRIDEQSILPVGSWETIYLSDTETDGPNEEAGGALASQAPDKIYLAVGSYMIDGGSVAQDANSSFGKIVEINLNTRRSRVVSRGHRNPQGLTFTQGGTLLSTEHGPSGGDELNLIVEKGNYGWPNVTLGTDYGKYAWRNNKSVGRHDGYQAPIFSWVPTIGVSSLHQIERFHQRWDGDILVASLKAQKLFRLRLKQGKVVYSEPIWIGQRVRDIAQLQDGTLVLWTDDTDLLFIAVDMEKLKLDQRNSTPISTVTVERCMYCHHFGRTQAGDFAPSLSNIIGKRIGSDNFRYSAAFRSKQEKWTENSLREFLSNPGRFASGSSMPELNLSKEDIDLIIHDLRSNSTIIAGQ